MLREKIAKSQLNINPSFVLFVHCIYMILSIKNEYWQIYMYREIQILKKIYIQPIEFFFRNGDKRLSHLFETRLAIIIQLKAKLCQRY